MQIATDFEIYFLIGLTILNFVALVIVIWVLSHRYCLKLMNFRDKVDVSTPNGKELLEEMNDEIDRMHGYRFFKGKPDKQGTDRGNN